MRELDLKTRILPLAIVVCLAGCAKQMADQPRYENYEPSRLFEDGMSARRPVPGTVARGQLRTDEHRYTGRVDGEPVEQFPQPVTEAMLARGRERYNIFCADCHGWDGYGEGMVVRRGYPRARSFHIERMRTAPVGHFFTVITDGMARMPSFKDRIPPDDRWAIIAYIRALQLSQHTDLEELSQEERQDILQHLETDGE